MNLQSFVPDGFKSLLTAFLILGFDTGPQFTFNFGGLGARMHQFGGPQPKR